MTYLGYGAFSWYRAELVTGAYDALINTGDSELIKNNDLSRKLAEYFSILKSGFEDQESSMNLLNNLQKIAETAILPLGQPKIRDRIGLDTIRNPKETEAIKFIFEQEAFFGLLFERTTLEHLRLSIQNDLFTRIMEILAIINEELE
jgi:hypothetical protein